MLAFINDEETEKLKCDELKAMCNVSFIKMIKSVETVITTEHLFNTKVLRMIAPVNIFKPYFVILCFEKTQADNSTLQTFECLYLIRILNRLPNMNYTHSRFRRPNKHT